MSTSTATVSDKRPSAASGLYLCPGRNLRTGCEEFSTLYSGITSLEDDMLRVAAAIYACDLAFKRGERENITRAITLHIPVVNYHAFLGSHERLTQILWILSHDSWKITLSRMNGAPEGASSWPKHDGATILFSGGADSLAGAIDLLSAHSIDGVQLASHVTANSVTRTSQDDLASYLEKKFGGPLRRVAIRTGGRNLPGFPFPVDFDREETQRTRSFMYLAIAALGARRSGHSKIIEIAENGQMAIHLPLSAARIGAFSTHTAHPEFLQEAAAFFGDVLDFPFVITNPFLYETKAQVIGRVITQHRAALPMSVSCWRSSRLGTQFRHCGECVPCLVRRIAFEHNGLSLPEYARDLLAEKVGSLDEQDEGKRNLVELVEFAFAFGTMPEARLEQIFPELTNPAVDKSMAIALYRRFAAEAQGVLRRYPGPAALFPPSTKTARARSRKKGTK